MRSARGATPVEVEVASSLGLAARTRCVSCEIAALVSSSRAGPSAPPPSSGAIVISTRDAHFSVRVTLGNELRAALRVKGDASEHVVDAAAFWVAPGVAADITSGPSASRDAAGAVALAVGPLLDDWVAGFSCALLLVGQRGCGRSTLAWGGVGAARPSIASAAVRAALRSLRGRSARGAIISRGRVVLSMWSVDGSGRAQDLFNVDGSGRAQDLCTVNSRAGGVVLNRVAVSSEDDARALVARGYSVAACSDAHIMLRAAIELADETGSGRFSAASELTLIDAAGSVSSGGPASVMARIKDSDLNGGTAKNAAMIARARGARNDYTGLARLLHDIARTQPGGPARADAAARLIEAQTARAASGGNVAPSVAPPLFRIDASQNDLHGEGLPELPPRARAPADGGLAREISSLVGAGTLLRVIGVISSDATDAAESEATLRLLTSAARVTIRAVRAGSAEVNNSNGARLRALEATIIFSAWQAAARAAEESAVSSAAAVAQTVKRAAAVPVAANTSATERQQQHGGPQQSQAASLQALIEFASTDLPENVEETPDVATPASSSSIDSSDCTAAKTAASTPAAPRGLRPRPLPSPPPTASKFQVTRTKPKNVAARLPLNSSASLLPRAVINAPVAEPPSLLSGVFELPRPVTNASNAPVAAPPLLLSGAFELPQSFRADSATAFSAAFQRNREIVVAPMRIVTQTCPVEMGVQAYASMATTAADMATQTLGVRALTTVPIRPLHVDSFKDRLSGAPTTLHVDSFKDQLSGAPTTHPGGSEHIPDGPSVERATVNERQPAAANRKRSPSRAVAPPAAPKQATTATATDQPEWTGNFPRRNIFRDDNAIAAHSDDRELSASSELRPVETARQLSLYPTSGEVSARSAEESSDEEVFIEDPADWRAAFVEEATDALLEAFSISPRQRVLTVDVGIDAAELPHTVSAYASIDAQSSPATRDTGSDAPHWYADASPLYASDAAADVLADALIEDLSRARSHFPEVNQAESATTHDIAAARLARWWRGLDASPSVATTAFKNSQPASTPSGSILPGGESAAPSPVVTATLTTNEGFMYERPPRGVRSGKKPSYDLLQSPIFRRRRSLRRPASSSESPPDSRELLLLAEARRRREERSPADFARSLSELVVPFALSGRLPPSALPRRSVSAPRAATMSFVSENDANRSPHSTSGGANDAIIQSGLSTEIVDDGAAKETAAATAISSAWRGMTARCNYLYMRWSVILIQARWRGCAVRSTAAKNVAKLRGAAGDVQHAATEVPIAVVVRAPPTQAEVAVESAPLESPSAQAPELPAPAVSAQQPIVDSVMRPASPRSPRDPIVPPSPPLTPVRASLHVPLAAFNKAASASVTTITTTLTTPPRDFTPPRVVRARTVDRVDVVRVGVSSGTQTTPPSEAIPLHNIASREVASVQTDVVELRSTTVDVQTSTSRKTPTAQTAVQPLDISSRLETVRRNSLDFRAAENATPAPLPSDSTAAPLEQIERAADSFVTQAERLTLIGAISSASDALRRVLREEEVTSISRTQTSVINMHTTHTVDDVASSLLLVDASNSISTTSRVQESTLEVVQDVVSLRSAHLTSDTASFDAQSTSRAEHNSTVLDVHESRDSNTQNISCAQTSATAQSTAFSDSLLSRTSVQVRESDFPLNAAIVLRDSVVSDSGAVLAAVADIRTTSSAVVSVAPRPSTASESLDLARILAAIADVQTDVQTAARNISLLSAAQAAPHDSGGASYPVNGNENPAPFDARPQEPRPSLTAVAQQSAAAISFLQPLRVMPPACSHGLVAVAATQTRVLPRTVGTQTRTRVRSSTASSQTAAPARRTDAASLALARTVEASTMMAHIHTTDAATSPQTPPRSVPALAPASPHRSQAPERAAGAAHRDVTPPPTDPGGPANVSPCALPAAPSLGSLARPLDEAWNNFSQRMPVGGSPGSTNFAAVQVGDGGFVSTPSAGVDTVLDEAVAATLTDLESEVARARAEAYAARARAAELEDAVANMSARLADIVIGTQDIASRDSIATADAAEAEAAAFMRASAAATAQLLKTQSLGLVAAALRAHDGGDATDVARTTVITDSDGRVLESSSSDPSARTLTSQTPAFKDVVAHARGFASTLRRSLSASADRGSNDGAKTREMRRTPGPSARTLPGSAVALLRRASSVDAEANGFVPGGSPGGGDATFRSGSSRSGRSSAEAISSVTAVSAVSVLVGEASQLLGGGLATLRASLARARLEAREATDSLAGARDELRRTALYKRAAVAAHKKLAHLNAGVAGERKGKAVDSWAIHGGGGGK